MFYRITIMAILSALIVGCNDAEIKTEEADSEEMMEATEKAEQSLGPVEECDEWLSPIELKEAWEMMNASVYEDKSICFKGYVLSNESYGNKLQGSIAFKEFNESDVNIPSVHCEFSGDNGAYFMNYERGDLIQIMGRLKVIDNPNKHNFMLTLCSLPERNEDRESTE